MTLIVVIVDRVGLGHSHDAAVDHLAAATRPIVDLAPAKRQKSASGLVQKSSPSKQKYSRPRLLLGGSGTRSGDQFLKF